MYTQIIIKNSFIKYKKIYIFLGIRMIDLSLDKLRLIAQIRNISDYKNKFKERLIKVLSEPKQETKPKPETKQNQNQNKHQNQK